MAELPWALIKDNVVTNVVIFDDPDEDLLNMFKEEYSVDEIVLADNNTGVGVAWDGTKFTAKQPYPSWILNENNTWISPVKMPTDGGCYVWDETKGAWEEVLPLTQFYFLSSGATVRA